MRGFGAVLAVAVMASPALAQDSVTLDLTLDPAAEAALQARGEWIVVNAWYYGDPALDGVPMDEMGLVYLGEEEATIYPVSQRIVLGGMTAGAPRDWVLDPILNVNVFSARLTDQNNLLDCGFVEGPVAELAASPQAISCSLLGQ